MEKESKTICDDCIHDVVCGEESHLEPACVYCAEKKPVSLLKRNGGELLLIDLIPYLNTGAWFTVIAKTSEPCNSITYIYPERFKVVQVGYDTDEQKIYVVVDKVD